MNCAALIEVTADDLAVGHTVTVINLNAAQTSVLLVRIMAVLFGWSSYSFLYPLC